MAHGSSSHRLLWHVGSSSLTRDHTHVPCIAWQILNHWTTREVPQLHFKFLLAPLRDGGDGNFSSQFIWGPHGLWLREQAWPFLFPQRLCFGNADAKDSQVPWKAAFP